MLVALTVAALSLTLVSPTVADLGTQIAEAARPIDEGVPEVAVSRLQNLSITATGTDLIAVKEKLAEALVAAKQPNEALRLMDEPSMPQAANLRMLRAEALTQLGHLDDALAMYRQVAAGPSEPQTRAAVFGAAEMLRATGQRDAAIQWYHRLHDDQRFGAPARLREAELFIEKHDSTAAKRLLDNAQPKSADDKRVKRLLRARLELLDQHPDRAAALLDPLTKKNQAISRETVIAILLAIADAHLQMKSPESGDDYLENFIEQHPNDPGLGKVFAKLDEVYRAEHKPPRVELEKWARDSAQPRRGFARWYLAQMELRTGRIEQALRQFEDIRKTSPLPPQLAPALLQYGQLQIDARHFDQALAILTAAERANPPVEVRTAIEFDVGRAWHGAGKFDDAAARFEEIGQAVAPLASAALYNASLCWLQANQPEKSRTDATRVALVGDQEGAGELSLEQALAAAQRSDGNASSMLHDFLRRFPNNPRVPEAHLALAERAFHSAPPKIEEAEKELAAARAGRPSAAVTERCDYLAVWLADAQGADNDSLIATANQFLREHGNSPAAADVRMKLAETHFRRQDFANAQTQFETFAQDNPKSPLTEKALFLAAQSAESSMASRSLEHALELLTQVVKMNGDLRWAARNEQAAIERRLGKPQDAQVLYDEVLKGDARGVEKREALCGKGDTLFEQANVEPASLREAVTIYDQLASEATNQPHWRNQALFKKGVCLEKQSDRAAALATFYQILEFNPASERLPELFWFYKAGFNAARLLEEQQKWQSAASVYQKLVAANGPRSDEAQARLTQLRLEHFLWQD